MKVKSFLLALVCSLLSALFLTDCAEKKSPEKVTASSNSDNATGEKRYEVRGRVIAVRKEDKRLELSHEEIKDAATGKTYMDAMTMPFAVKDVTLLENLKPGDQVQATLVVVENASLEWLEKITMVTAAGK